MEETEFTNASESAKRPNFLTVLCILTFISAGLTSLVSLITPLFADTIIAFYETNPAFDETQKSEIMLTVQAGWAYHAPTFLLALCSLIGATLMWQLKKIGFHFYASTNLALLFLPMLMLNLAVSWMGIAVTIAFIAMYATHYKLFT